MMSFRALVRPCVLACLASIVLPTASASAAIVTMHFEGSLTFKLGTTLPGLAAGNTFSGFATYDTSAVGTPSFESAFFASGLLAYSVTYNTSSGPVVLTADVVSGTFTEGQGGNAGLSVTENEPDGMTGDVFDRFSVYGASTANGVSMITGFVSKTTLPSSGPISSLSPPESFNLADFNISRGFTLSRTPSVQFPGLNIAQGTITSVTFVPAPGAAAPLLACSLLAARRRRR